MPALTAVAGSAVQQQHPDQGTGSGSVTVLLAGGVPVPLMNRGERSGCPRGDQGGGSGHGTGFAGEDFQVVVQHEVLAALVQRPGVFSDHLLGVEHDYRGGAETNVETATGEPGRDRVVRLTDTDRRLGIDPA
jgi:hypothetical protein